MTVQGLETARDVDPFDARLAVRASGMLAAFNQAGVLDSADVHVASTLGRLTQESREAVLLAAALAVRAVRLGSVCVDLARVRETALADVDPALDARGLAWPEPSAWSAACADSPLVAEGVSGPPDRPVRLVDGLLYLDRYWREEQLVRTEIDARGRRPPPEVDEARLSAALARLFPGDRPDHQRLAAAACATGWLTIVAGGPGTGKTTTVARLLALLAEVLHDRPRVALAAPTGKAAARLQEAVGGALAALVEPGSPSPGPLAASTLHRLLGFRPGSRHRFRYDRANRLPYDVVVVDETSMVSLTLMARLLEAIRPDARLVLVGDPDQLASVEAGVVLGDLVARPTRAGPDDRTRRLERLAPGDLAPREAVAHELRNDVVRLRTIHRFGARISALAKAVRAGDAEDVLAALHAGDADLELVAPGPLDHRPFAGLTGLREDVVAAGRRLHEAARAGDVAGALGALEQHMLLCAHRRGPYGVERWSVAVHREGAAAVDRAGAPAESYAGQPLLVTANDYDLGLFNGDLGVVVDSGEVGLVAAFSRGGEPLLVAPSRLSAVQTVHAMTVHRAQGSQFDAVSVLLPPPDSPLLSRELFYTAVTRAKTRVRVVGSEEAVVAAVTRPVVRASGLRRPVAASAR